MENASKATMNLERITRTVRACYIDLEEENKKLKDRIEELSGRVLHELAENEKLKKRIQELKSELSREQE